MQNSNQVPILYQVSADIETVHRADNGQTNNDKSKPVMTAYKVITNDAPYWGSGYRIEHTLLLELGRPTLVKSMEDFDQGLLPESKDIYSGQRAQLST
ncbi:uncharacterized protein LOC110752785 isoform X2 [Prunus avium]|uniref:Uncharacterized protein LOC110752785 isoform X2 n=1 Tax=Prunus avium TaxID=42229 RepID=A0A6P5RWI5_PRUAV|nr:uncharacterized protein LOC110752785 isoform X2 [Prunus avium]